MLASCVSAAGRAIEVAGGEDAALCPCDLQRLVGAAEAVAADVEAPHPPGVKEATAGMAGLGWRPIPPKTSMVVPP